MRTMMRFFRTLMVFIIGLLIAQMASASGIPDKTMTEIKNQLIRKDDIFEGRYPAYTIDGRWQFLNKVNWLSGFIGGQLWYMYDMTGDPQLKTRAIRHSDSLLLKASIDYTHDMGFIFLPTLVKTYQETGETKYRDGAIRAAEMLAKRYNENGRFIRAWGKLGTEDRAGWMIIDTMMNLKLLFWAAQATGNRHFYDIAYRHALTAMKEAVRPDGSSYHVIEFNPQTRKVLKKRTHQGIADESTWARGQAWGIYGFAAAYKYTRDKRFLAISQKMADYLIARLPADDVPYWDLDLSGDDVLRDASAGAVAASGMFQLARLSDTKDAAEKYSRYARQITWSLLNNYLFTKSSRPVEQGILIHTLYHYHKKWGVDESYPAGDYFFVEALWKLWNLEQQENLVKDKAIRQVYNLDKKWYYLEDNIRDIRQLYTSARIWQCIDLPHTWNRFDATDNIPGYRRDASWYEKNLFVPELKNNLKLSLYFESANIVSDVYVNDQYAGGHVGGYVGFEVDITPYLKYGQDNTIRVRVDNAYDPEIIPSQKSDFFIYGGIPRDVWLKVVPENHLRHLQIKTPQVSQKKASTEVVVAVSSTENNPAKYEIEAILKNPSGNTVAKKNIKQVVSRQDTIVMIMPEIKNPRLWSPSSPELYTAEVTLKKDGHEIDRLSGRFGYRWFEFKEHGPFYLNGKRLLLRGTHRHEEYAGYGEAMPNALQRKDMEMIKEMGANFVRLAHYPQDPEVYKACDELGILVWDELPWCRGGVGDSVWQGNTKRLLKEMIRQNDNHPSIIMWSLGNEIYWLPDFPGGGNVDSLRAFLGELNDIAHKLDPSRVTAVRKFYEGSDIVDVFSPSIWAGWYSGVYKNYEKAITKARDDYRRFFHAEYGGASLPGRHVENPVTGDGVINPEGWEEAVNQVQVKNIAKYGDWSENYIVDLFDWHLHVSENLDWFSGNAQWAFKDFGTPLRPENAIPYINQKGLTDRAGIPKDAYYVFKSYWTDAPSFCYIESHTWTERSGPSGVSREVAVYSNCEAVELSLNGTPLGRIKRDRQRFPAQGLTWKVQFSEGDNLLRAAGYSKGKIVTVDSIHIHYTYRKNGSPDRVVLSADKLPNGNYLVEALMVDKNGQRCLDYNDRMYFDANGDGQLLLNYGTPTRSQVIEMANGRAAIEFHPLPDGTATIEARNQDFKGSYLVIPGDDKSHLQGR